MVSRINSEKLYQKLCEVIPGGVNSPVRACKAVGQVPLVASHAQGDLIFDVDDKSYIDYCMSWGALIHGHAHPTIGKALGEQISKGTSYGTTTHVEEKLARKVVQLMPHMEMVRFVSSGTEATMSAVRLARGYTGRDLVIKYIGHYHGHADYFLVKAGSGVMNLQAASSKGIPLDSLKQTLCLPFNDLEATRAAFREFGDRIACVIVEPVAGNMGVVASSPDFMQMLQEETTRTRALLIFDEVMTCFRINKGGAKSYYGITPDLTCLGKIVGGGLPAAAFGGKRAIMEYLAPLGPVYQAGTLSGNPLAMVAGLTALEMLDLPGFYEELQRKTDLLLAPLKSYLAKHNACIQSAGSMFTLFFGKRSVHNMSDAEALDTTTFAKFFRFLFERGIYIPPFQQEAWFISMAHTDAHLKLTADSIIDFFEQV